jgi:Transposase zinc-ribbon domain
MPFDSLILHTPRLFRLSAGFANFENCKKVMVQLRWPDGVVKCPHCGSEKVTFLAKARVWKCYAKHERPTFSLKTGTIFEESPVGLDKWLPALWLLVIARTVSGHANLPAISESRRRPLGSWRIACVLLSQTVVPVCYPAKLRRMRLSSAARPGICTLKNASAESLARVERIRQLYLESWSGAVRFARRSFPVAGRERFKMRSASTWRQVRCCTRCVDVLQRA